MSQTEDCLYLNVITSLNCNSTNLCPVLFFIHGGGNEFLSPIVFPVEAITDNFASRDITVVSIGYRLGILGFFSTGTKEAYGNFGLEGK